MNYEDEIACGIQCISRNVCICIKFDIYPLARQVDKYTEMIIMHDIICWYYIFYHISADFPIPTRPTQSSWTRPGFPPIFFQFPYNILLKANQTQAFGYSSKMIQNLKAWWWTWHMGWMSCLPEMDMDGLLVRYHLWMVENYPCMYDSFLPRN